MLFNSLSFGVFFPIVVGLYYLVRPNWRTVFLLFASCYFYMVFVPKYILILLFLIMMDYSLGKLIEKNTGRQRKILLIISILSNLGMLFVFKYFNFFNENIVALANFLHWNYSVAAVSIILPLGLSFHVFQSLSYVIEVYRGKFKAENNFFTYALYVMFFPQLVAGPIERPGHLLPQLNMTHNFNATNVRRGLERMLWGFFKKLVIADQIAIIVNHLYTNLPYDGPTLLLLMFLFTYQLYCDFSGYSDIAIGSAMVLGFNLVENFNRPFASQSIAEYWRRWHISLSSWLRDYLYYPMVLGFGKVSKIRLYLSLFITFTLIGLWHGANWTFVIMGAMHGFYLVFASLTENVRQKFATVIGLTKFPKIRRLIKILIVFFLVSLGNIFFRAENVGQAWQIISHLGDNFLDIFNVDFLRYQIFTEATLGVWKSAVVVIVLAIVFMEVIQFIQKYKKNIYIFEEKTKAVRYGWYYVLTLTILFFGYFGAQPFVYFKF